MKHKITMVMASSLACALGAFGVGLTSGAAADHGQGSVVVVGGSGAGNGDSFNGGLNAGPTSSASAEGGRGGAGGNGGDVHRGRGHGGWDGSGGSGGSGSGGGHGSSGGSGGTGGSGGSAGAQSGARGGGNAASESGVHNSGNSANTNVTSANIQVNPEIKSSNKSTNVVISSNENDNDNSNDNDNRADADADAAALNGNVNLNVGVNAVENTNTDTDSNFGSNAGTNSNSGANSGTNSNAGTQTNTNNGPPQSTFEGQTVCESYGGTFTIGTGTVVWTCTNLATLSGDAFTTRFIDLDTACIADAAPNAAFNQEGDPPQDATCSG